jgi:heme-degrading monooxygenase HmoA
MIARTWHGWTRAGDAGAYLAYLEETGLKRFRQEPGNVAAFTLVREHEDRSHFVVISIWDDLDSIRGFAGDPLDRAVFFPRDDRFLIARDEHVDHFDLAFAAGAFSEGDPKAHHRPPRHGGGNPGEDQSRDWVRFAVGLR